MCERERERVCGVYVVCVRECVREMECLCVREMECLCVREMECLCVREKERGESVCGVCVVCMWCVCGVCEREIDCV